MSHEAEEFRQAMEDSGARVTRLGHVIIGALKACDCGCGRPTGVLLHAPDAAVMKTRTELATLMASLRMAAEALGWDPEGL